jgi:hypothetical protein
MNVSKLLRISLGAGIGVLSLTSAALAADDIESSFEAPYVQAAAVARPVCSANATWGSIAGTVARVRVWYDKSRADDLTQAQAIVAALDNKIWPTLITDLGFKLPLSDLSRTCNGGDNRLDIFVVAGLASRGETYPESASLYQSTTYIAVRSGLSGGVLNYTITHQFMHAVQWSYLMVATQLSYGWMRNALANWAVEAVYPGNATLLADASCHMNSTFLPITNRSTGACTNDANRTRDYGAYLLYQYIGRTSGNVKVRELLEATTTTSPTALDAIDTTVTGGLRTLWPKYAKTLWNKAPVTGSGKPAFLNWDGQTAVPVYAPDHPATVNANLSGTREAKTSLSSSVENVSTRFYRFTFSDVATRSLMFHNTFYPLYKAGKKVSVQAMWRPAGGSWVQENWTTKEWIGLCRDRKSQRVAEIVVIVASGEVVDVTQVVAAKAPTLKRNNIGCWGFSGTAKRTTVNGSWSSGTVTLFSTPRFDHSTSGGQYNNAATGRLRVPITAPLFRTVGWSLAESYTEDPCSYALSKSGTGTSIYVGGDAFGSMVINNFPESLPADLRQDQYALIGTVRGAYTANLSSALFGLFGTVTGPEPECGTFYQSSLASFLLTNGDAGSGPVVRLDGHLAGTFVDASGGDSTTWIWDLEPLLEP